MSRFGIEIALAACLAAASAHAASDVDTAKELIRRAARDPGSVTFSGVQLRPEAVSATGKKVRVVCGSFNARNGFGGFVGAQPFVYLPASGLIAPKSDSQFERLLAEKMFESVCR